MKAKSSGTRVRKIAFIVLSRVFKGKLLDDTLKEEIPINLPRRDRDLIVEIVYGVLRNRLLLDTLIPPTAEKSLRSLLEIALYQLHFLSRMPDYAVVDTSVELARVLFGEKQARFINAILRKTSQKKFVLPNKEKDPVRYISVKYSHPLWLVKYLSKRWDIKEVEQLCAFNNTKPSILLRVNTLKISIKEFLKKCSRRGIELEKTSHHLVYKVKSKDRITEIPGYTEGWFYVQDISTLYPIERMSLRGGMRVLDLCASPGGKSTYIAQLMKGKGLIVANDVSLEKVKFLMETVKRMDMEAVIKPVCSNNQPFKEESFHRILIDAPCSNTGVFRRRVDARWRVKKEDIPRLAELQLSLLERGKRLVKRGGIIVYSTCSILSEENECVVGDFLQSNTDFFLRESTLRLPHKSNSDGGFFAVLIRNK